MTTIFKVQFFCSCGAGMAGDVGVRDGKKEETEKKLKAIWDELHTGPGHSPCTREEAGRAAIRNDLKDIEENNHAP